MYLALSFIGDFPDKFGKRQAPPEAGGTEGYSVAMRDGLAAGLEGLADQALAAVGNEMPERDSSYVGIALDVRLNGDGVAEVFISVFPANTNKPEPLFLIGPHISVLTTDPTRERLRFCTTVLNINPLPEPAIIAAMCQAEARAFSQQIARDGFPADVKRAIAGVGKAFRYITPESLADSHWKAY